MPFYSDPSMSGALLAMEIAPPRAGQFLETANISSECIFHMQTN